MGVGTGGTVTGVGRYLKERNPAITIVGADPEGSIYTGDVHSYLIEGVGEDFWPETFDPAIIDRWVQISDRDAFLCARRVAAAEGILIGGSGGMAVQAALNVAEELTPDKTVLVILPDGGRPYLSKVFDDDWMRSHGLLDRPGLPPIVADLMHAKSREAPELPSDRHDRGRRAELRRDRPAAALRHLAAARPRGRRSTTARRASTASIGSIEERSLLDRVFREGGEVLARPVEELMSPPLAIVDMLAAARRSLRRAAVASRARGRRRAPPGRRRADAHRPARVPRPPPRRSLLEVPLEAARRLVVGARRLPQPAPQGDARRASRRRSSRLGCVQLDAISTVDRSQRLVLAVRTGRVPDGAQDRLLRRGRVFEYWAHEASLIPVGDWPYFVARMRDRRHHQWFGPVLEQQPELVERILATVAERGPVSSRDFGGAGTGYWNWSDAKRALEALWTSGQLVVAGRRGVERLLRPARARAAARGAGRADPVAASSGCAI